MNLLNFYGEFGTDKYLRENFFSDYLYKGVMIEVGAGPTVMYSISKHFRENGWRCISFDPNPKFAEAHRLEGHEIYQLAIADFIGQSTFKLVDTGKWGPSENISYSALDIRYPGAGPNITEITVEVQTLNNVLKDTNISSIDLLVVDTEGWELEVIKGLDTQLYKPKIIVLENWLHDSKYHDYMKSINYRCIHNIDYNYIYIPE